MFGSYAHALGLPCLLQSCLSLPFTSRSLGKAAMGEPCDAALQALQFQAAKEYASLLRSSRLLTDS